MSFPLNVLSAGALWAGVSFLAAAWLVWNGDRQDRKRFDRELAEWLAEPVNSRDDRLPR